MLSARDLILSYNNVLQKEFQNYNVSEDEFKSAIQNLLGTYRSNPFVWMKETSSNADYNDAAHRCAYLHKYAPIHSCMVQDMLCRALREGKDVFKETFMGNTSCINICSLGGGPGVDVIGILSTLHKEFGFQHYSVQVVDSMVGWKDMFNSVIEEYRSGYGEFSKNLNSEYLQHSFIPANLLEEMDASVTKAIGSANLITMIKFLSGAACKNSEQMVRTIFTSMTQGAFLLFIDNAAGGFSELVSRLGDECKLLPVFGPLNHEQYTNEMFGLIRRCGSKSCHDIRITVHLLMKYNVSLNQNKILMHPINKDLENEPEPQKLSDSLAEILNKTVFNNEEAFSNVFNNHDDFMEFDVSFDEDRYFSDCCNCSSQDCDLHKENYDLDLDKISCDKYIGSITIMNLSSLF